MTRKVLARTPDGQEVEITDPAVIAKVKGDIEPISMGIDSVEASILAQPDLLRDVLGLPREDETPTVNEVSGTLRRHPELLYELLRDIRLDPPKIAGPWHKAKSKVREPATKYARRNHHGNVFVVVRLDPAHNDNYVFTDSYVFTVKGPIGDATRPGRSHTSAAYLTVEEAKAGADDYLRQHGWALLDV